MKGVWLSFRFCHLLFCPICAGPPHLSVQEVDFVHLCSLPAHPASMYVFTYEVLNTFLVVVFKFVNVFD